MKTKTGLDDSIFRPAGTVAIPASESQFDSRLHFVQGTARGSVPILAMDEVFSASFLDIVYPPRPADRILCGYFVHENITDGATFRMVSIEDLRAPLVGLDEIFYLMSLQPRGQKGVLLTGDSWNTFFAAGEESVGNYRIYTVSVFWKNQGWLIDADLVTGEAMLPLCGQLFIPSLLQE